MRICCHSQDPHFRVGDADSRGVPCRVVVDLGLNRSSNHHPCLLAPSSAPSAPRQSTCLLPVPCAASPGPPTALHPASRGPGLAPASSCFSASFLYMPAVHSLGFAHSAHPPPYTHPSVQASLSALSSVPSPRTGGPVAVLCPVPDGPALRVSEQLHADRSHAGERRAAGGVLL